MKRSTGAGAAADEAATDEDRETSEADAADRATAADDADERIGEMAAELDHLGTSIDEAKRAAAADPYFDVPDPKTDVTEGEERSP